MEVYQAMNENPEGTPNPLNPAPEMSGGTPENGGAEAAGTGALDFVETAISSETPETFEAVETAEVAETSAASTAAQPASFTEAATNSAESQPVTASAMPEMATAAPTSSAMPEMKTARPSAVSSRNVVDPMMRPATHTDTPQEASQMGTAQEVTAQKIEVKDSNFDTLTMDETTIEELKSDNATPGTTEAVVAESVTVAEPLVVKDSIVEPAGKGKKKKGLVIFAVICLVIALGCGAAAVAIMMINNNNNGDRVAKAIEKLIDGEAPTIVGVQGSINAVSDDASTSMMSSADIDFNGTFSMTSPLNTVSATINTEFGGGNKVTLDLEEMKNEDGDAFIKVSGFNDLLNSATLPLTTDLEDAENLEETGVIAESDSVEVTNCIGSQDMNCTTTTDTTGVIDGGSMLTAMLSAYGGLFDAIDDEWIMVPSNFADSMGELGLFNNTSACLINAFGTLQQYGKDIASKYNANQFITYSTDNLEIAKKKNPLYRLTIDHDKMTAFVNSLSSNGFINELNACAGNTATNTDVATSLIEGIFANFPTVYVEIDDNYNFTRVYFKATLGNNGDNEIECIQAPCGTSTTTVTADLNLSYPAKIEVTEPEDYLPMSELVNNVLTSLFSSGETIPSQQ